MKPCVLFPLLLLTFHVAFALDLSTCPVRFVTGMLHAADGKIWVAGEAAGPAYLDIRQAENGWKSVGYEKGFPTNANCYALAEDKQGRIWVGTDHSGVAIFNGLEWKVYGVQEALPGERVFSIAVSPLNGDVAIATSGGIAIYQPEKDKWLSITRTNGLPEDQAYSVHFDNQGTLWAGFSCYGIGMAPLDKNYKTWKHIHTNWYWDKEQHTPQPKEQAGEGLPSNQINIISSLQDGSIWAGTVAGLGYKLKNSHWRFCRGKDFKDKNAGLYQVNATANRTNTSYPRILLPEDFITSLVPAGKKLLIGFRQQGACLLDPANWTIEKSYHIQNSASPTKWINGFLQMPDGSLWAGTFGGGIVCLDKQAPCSLKQNQKNLLPSLENPCFPSVASPSSDQELTATYLAFIKKEEKEIQNSDAVFFGEDWSTRGDWCLRHGKDYVLLCGANAPLDNVQYLNSIMSMNYICYGTIGPNQKNDGLRHWVETINDKNNRNVLISPDFNIRTESEWDDHGEAYPQSFDGPDVWIAVTIPPGKHMLSIYFYNPNGRKQLNNSLRDYLVEIRKIRPNMQDLKEFSTVKEDYEHTSKARAEHAGNHLSSPVLARTRVNYFSGSGVYKSFLVSGPGNYYVRVARNHSFNTIVNGIFISCLAYPDRNKWNTTTSSGRNYNFSLLKDFLDAPYPYNFSWISNPSPFLSKEYMPVSVNIRTIAAYRQYMIDCLQSLSNKKEQTATDRELISHIKWCLNLYEKENEKKFDDYLMDLWNIRQEHYPCFRSVEWAKYSPNVIPFSINEVETMAKMKVDWKQYLPGHKPQIPIDEMKRKIHLFATEKK